MSTLLPQPEFSKRQLLSCQRRMGRARWPALALGVLVSVTTLAAIFIYFWISRGSIESASAKLRSTPSESPSSEASTAAGLLTRITLSVLNRPQTVVEKMAMKHDVTVDDWDTERRSQQIDSQLSKLAELIKHPAPSQNTVAMSRLIAPGATCQPLVPSPLRIVFDDGSVAVRRASLQLPRESSSSLAHELDRLSEWLGNSKNKNVKFKLVHISEQDQRLHTRLLYEAHSRNAAEGMQQTATWLCQWKYREVDGTALPMIVTVALEEYEEVQIQMPEGRLFVDCTKAVIGNNTAYQEQVLPGIPFWLTRMPREFMGQFGHHGIAVGDVNNDGLDDIYVCDAGGLPNRLYVQKADGTAVDVAHDARVDFLEDSTGALLIDLDNDGDQDLLVATDPLIQIAENDGTGRFKLRESLYVNTDTYSLCAADYDRDKDLDVYVCGYSVRKRMGHGLPFPLPYHDANNGGKNILLRNDGNFKFTDATKDAGLDVNNSRFSLAAAWDDFDNDGDLDLYVANDFGRNNLFRNDGARFTDIASVAQVEDRASGMSVSWGDYDRDGWMDLYVSNMFSAAGNRVTSQRRFSDGISNQVVINIRRMARGNTLFASNGAGLFQDVSQYAGVTMGRWAWASKFADLNNDGWQDLVVLNGYVTNESTDDL